MDKTTTQVRLEWTGDAASDDLVSADPAALFIGFCLDQQITVEQAFMGPLRIKERLGTIDVGKLATLDPTALEAAFRQRPAIHRFPVSMATRVQKLCSDLSSHYGGDPTRIWTEAKDGKDLYARLRKLPGFGEMKAKTIVKLVGQYWRPDLPGWQDVAPTWPTLADVRTTDERIAYQTKKRAHKAALRAQQKQ